MCWMIGGRRMQAALFLAAMLAASACGSKSAMPADKAFALSASALSGSERFAFRGEVSWIDPNGVIADHARFDGEVTGHDKLKMNWTDGRTIRYRSFEGLSSYRPLQLIDAIKDRDAAIAYAGTRAGSDETTFQVTFTDDAARRRVAAEFLSELAQLKAHWAALSLPAEKRMEGERVLAKANRDLELALSSLRARTVCLWSADRRTWFPLSVTEHTEWSYAWQNETRREKRVSVTNFLPEGRSGTMVGNGYNHP